MGVRMDVLGVLACLLGSVIVLSQRVWDWGVLLLALALAGASLVIHSRLHPRHSRPLRSRFTNPITSYLFAPAAISPFEIRSAI